MKLGRVIGNIWATRKDERLVSRRMLLVQPMSFSGTDRGEPITALDTMDAGTQDVVIYATSAEAAIPFQPGLTPTDATIVGIVDRVDHDSWRFRSGDQQG
ncbi:MAG: EutN/CcmL family microcompartment protein [Rhodothermales bacterium]|nr:EutN/CcmL family microcompartment protein [Rhodothermales bacterium]